MAYPASVMKVQFGGSLPRGEKWATGFQLKSDSALTQTIVDATQGAVAGTLSSGSGPLFTWRGQQPTGFTISYVKVYGYTGGQSATFTSQQGLALTGSGTPATMLPLQCAVVVSLLTGKPGRSFRGRMYFPANGYANADGQVNASILANLTSVAQALLQAAEGTGTGLPSYPVVASGTKGMATRITSVYADSRFDIQRNRAKSETILRTATLAVA